MFGAHDTTFRSAASWGERALKFQPGVGVRTAGPPQTDRGPGYHAAMGGAKAHPSQISVPPKDEFVAGGWNRNGALAHLRRDAKGGVVCEGGLLGESFNEYLRDMPPVELERLYEDYTDGIDAWRHVDAAATEGLRPSEPELLEQRKKRLPTKAEVFNSATVAAHLEAACEEVTKCIASGALRVLGTIEDVAARGDMPLYLNPLTMETSKIRLCCNQRKLNSMSSWPTVELDGLQTIEDAVRGRAAYGAVSDEASGYHHHALSEASQELFGVVFLGHVMVYTVLSFGWGPSCFYHQGHGMVTAGYHRAQGGLVLLYIGEFSLLVNRCWGPLMLGEQRMCEVARETPADWLACLSVPRVTADDHTLVGREGADQSSTERDVYAFYSLKGLFGYYLSPTKTMWEVAEVFRTLGLECDTVRQAWLVPADKRAEYIHIAEVLTRQLAEGSPDPWALSRFAGKTVYYRRACDTLKYYQCLQYAVLSNRKLHREAVPTDHRWWLERHEDRRPLSGRLRRLLTEEIAMCVALVATDRVHRFVSDEHVVLRADGGRVQLFTDTTLHTFGAVLRAPEATDRPRVEVVLGGVLPEEVAGVYIAKCNTGVVEEAGMVHVCRIIDRTPGLLMLVVNRMFDLLMDNFEVRDCKHLQVPARHVGDTLELGGVTDWVGCRCWWSHAGRAVSTIREDRRGVHG